MDTNDTCLSLQDVICKCGENPEAVANAALCLRGITIHITAAAMMEKQRPGQLTSAMLLFQLDAMDAIIDMMKRRREGIFSNDDVHREVSEKKIEMFLVMSACSAFNIDFKQMSEVAAKFHRDNVIKSLAKVAI